MVIVSSYDSNVLLFNLYTQVVAVVSESFASHKVIPKRSLSSFTVFLTYEAGNREPWRHVVQREKKK